MSSRLYRLSYSCIMCCIDKKLVDIVVECFDDADVWRQEIAINKLCSVHWVVWCHCLSWGFMCNKINVLFYFVAAFILLCLLHMSTLTCARNAAILPSALLDIWVTVIVWRLRGNIIRTALCRILWHNVHSQQHTYISSSYRSNRLG